jgi:hypothetical protein
VASVRRFVLHAFVHFLGFEDLLAVGKSNIYTFADGVWAFAFKGENVGQERLCANVGHGRHRSPRSEYMSPLCTVHHPSVAAFYATGQRRAVDRKYPTINNLS